MKRGYLSEYFEGAAVKRLSAVEINPNISNQHEFQGIAQILAFLGKPSEARNYPAKFIFLDDSDQDAVIEEASLTLYDARKKQEHRSAEYRLYYPTNQVSSMASEGDLLVVAKLRHEESLLVLIVKGNSTTCNQIEWLFGLTEVRERGFTPTNLDTQAARNRFVAGIVLRNIGIEPEETQDDFLDGLLSKFPSAFPTTKEFSAYTRATLKHVNAQDNSDAVLMVWLEREEILFRTLERYLIINQLQQGFGGDVDAFIKFSLSVQNRRKSRAGYSLENHLEYLFTERGIRYSRAALTEGRSKPDFLFPGSAEYHDSGFPEQRLTMLGVKTTSKDRWRQILAEADRIRQKHLLTLEPGISVHQTDEMQARDVRLVLPQGIHASYTEQQQKWLMNVEDFMELASGRQAE